MRLQRHEVLGALAWGVLLCAVTKMAVGSEGVDAVGYVAALLTGVAMTPARIAPRLTLGLVTLPLLAYVLSDQPGGPVFLGAFAAAINLGVRRPDASTWLPPVLVAGSAIIVASSIVGGWSLHFLPFIGLFVLAPQVGADAARKADLKAARQEEETARRMAEERLRIAREVHDVVGHSLSTIALRAGIADHVADPDEAREALRAIRKISRQSLGELSALLGVLRGDEGEGRAPTPDLEALPGLVDRLREAGMTVQLEIEADGGVPEVVGAAGYRIVQEALTNVARHAGPSARAHVRLARCNGAVEVEVLDDGRGATIIREGGGMAGMRERVAALGGTFQAGAAPGGGFRVFASLPAHPR